MPEDNKQQLRTNEDFSKSYTHDRPAPDTNPPSSRASSVSSDQNQSSTSNQGQSDSNKK